MSSAGPGPRSDAPAARLVADPLRAILDALPIGAVLFDPREDGFLAFNDAACAQLGYEREAFGRLTLADIDLDPLVFVARRRLLRAGDPPRRFATVQRSRDGSPRDVDVTVQCVVLDGRELGFAVWHDVTDHRETLARLREREAELARVQRIGQLGGFEIDLLDGFRNRRSPEYLRLHRLPADATTESHEAWVRRLHPDDRERAERRFLDAVRGDAADYVNEYRIEVPGGDLRWIRALGEIERDAQGRPVRMVGAHLDVTDLKRAEAAAAEQSARLLEADRRKDEFLAVLSHELRNPLAALNNALVLLARPGLPADASAAMLQIARRQSKQLARLVDDLLEVSRISAGKIVLRREPLAIAEVVSESTEALGAVLRERGQSLSLRLQEPVEGWRDVRVDADRARLEQVMENLLGNASKYSDDGAQIRVALQHDGDHVVIDVEDDGAGIPVDALEAVFDLFAQVEGSRERSRGGLGIGLALVRRLVALHGGTVAAHSDGPGRGARFTVRLPLASFPAGDTGSCAGDG